MRRRHLLALAAGVGTIGTTSVAGEANDNNGPGRREARFSPSGRLRGQEDPPEWCEEDPPEWCEEDPPEWCEEDPLEWCEEDPPEWCEEDSEEWCEEDPSEWCEEDPTDYQIEGSIERLDAGCTTGKTAVATVCPIGDSLRVRGVIEAPTPCYELVLESVDVDEDEDVLTIVVGVGDPLDGFCIQCVGAVRYEVRLTFEVDPPETVVIHHRTMGETRRAGPEPTTGPR